MPTGPQHYVMAERLVGMLGAGHDPRRPEVPDPSPATEARFLAEAQVHATLALAAATALQVPSGEDAGMHVADISAWEQACSAAVPVKGGTDG